MNRFLLILFSSILFFSCKKTINKPIDFALVDQSQNGNLTKEIVDISASKIYWKGTKMRGLGKHEGEVKLKEGFFLIDGDKVVGGKFIVDMTTINVTDIPEYETVPRRNLNKHLKSDDFFAVSEYPFASFEIEGINLNQVSGTLTIRNVSKKIQIESEITKVQKNFKITSSFTINRFDWNVGYTGSWIDKTLVDKNIQFTIKIVN